MWLGQPIAAWVLLFFAACFAGVTAYDYWQHGAKGHAGRKTWLRIAAIFSAIAVFLILRT